MCVRLVFVIGVVVVVIVFVLVVVVIYFWLGLIVSDDVVKVVKVGYGDDGGVGIFEVS